MLSERAVTREVKTYKNGLPNCSKKIYNSYNNIIYKKTTKKKTEQIEK